VDRGEHPSKWTASVYRHDLDRTSPAVPPQVPSSSETTAYTELRAGGAVTLFAGRHAHWSGGVDASRERGNNRSILDLPCSPGGRVRGDYDLTRTLLGAYSEALVERGRLSLELVVRLDHFDRLDPHGRRLQVDPRAGVSYRFSDGATRLHASAGRAFQLPSFFALASPRALGGNKQLRPETTVGGDAGIERSFAALGLQLAATLFYNRFHDLIDFDFRTFLHVNRAAVAAQGAELSVAWRAGRRVRVAANATRQEVADLSTHARLLHQPRWVGGGAIDWQPATSWSVRLDVQAVARTLDHELPVPGRDLVAGYQLLGLASSWQLSDRWRLRGRIDNLTDRRYQVLIGFPGARRGLRLGLAYTR
jgi:outer membrane receptor protein involved in Fe transport